MLTSNSKGIVYFNNAGQARLTKEVEEAGVKAVQSQPWEQDGPAAAVRIRQLFGQLVQTSGENIAIMPCTSHSITFAAQNIQRTVPEGGSVLLLEDQFPSAVYPWQQLCEEGPWKLSIITYPEKDQTWTNLVLERLQLEDDIRVVCLPPLHWSDGSRIDLDIISDTCKAKGIVLIVDATQAVGAMPINVEAWDAAMLACSSHKWLRGPSGGSLVYINPRMHDSWLPLDQHGRDRITNGASDASRHQLTPDGYPARFVTDASKFDSGGRANSIILPMLRASLEQVASQDLEAVQSTLQSLMQPVLDWASRNSLIVPTNGVAHLIGIRVKNMKDDNLTGICKALADENIFVAARCGGFRISAYLDNSREDVQRLLEAMARLIEENSKY